MLEYVAQQIQVLFHVAGPALGIFTSFHSLATASRKTTAMLCRFRSSRCRNQASAGKVSSSSQDHFVWREARPSVSPEYQIPSLSAHAQAAPKQVPILGKVFSHGR